MHGRHDPASHKSKKEKVKISGMFHTFVVLTAVWLSTYHLQPLSWCSNCSVYPAYRFPSLNRAIAPRSANSAFA